MSLKLQLVYQTLYFQTLLFTRNPNIGVLNPPLTSSPGAPCLYNILYFIFGMFIVSRKVKTEFQYKHGIANLTYFSHLN